MKRHQNSNTIVVLALGAAWLLANLPSAQAVSHPPQQSWNQLIKSGTDALDSNQYWLAEPLLKQAVVSAAAFGDGDPRLAKSLGELGRLYTIRGRFEEADPYLEEQLHVTELALGKENGQTIPAMGSLIHFYLVHGTLVKAKPLTEELLAFLEGKLKDNMALSQVRVKLKKGMPLEAGIAEAAPEARDPLIEWAIACDDLGNLYREKADFDTAERLYKAALDLKSTVLGKEHLSLANSYESLGLLCQERGDTASAEGYFKDSLAMTQKILSDANPQTYNRLDRLAKSYIKDGKYKEAEDLYLRAQTSWKNSDSHQGEEIRALFALGSLYAQEKNYEAAAPVLERALQLAEENEGPASVNLVPYLQRYAYALYYLHRKPEVEALKERASTIAGGGIN
jgi:tetratricopeptide (TPR) repeat protein